MAKNIHDIITVGSATIDVFVKTDNELIKIKTSKGEEDLIAYPSGRKILINQLDFMTGGGATNTAVCFARLGLKTGCISALGKDDNAKTILRELKKEKIDFIGTVEKEDMTAYSIVLDSIEHDRSILTYKAISNKLKFEKLKKNRIKAKWYYFCTMMQESFKTLEKLAKFAEKNNSKIAFNPTNYLAKEGPKKLKTILERTTALVLNLEEAKLLLGLNPDDKTIKVEKLMKDLNALGPNIIVITDGKNGAYCYEGCKYDKDKNISKRAKTECKNKRYIYFIKPRPINVLETTGAGDAFTSTFVAGLIKGKPIEFCLFMAQTNVESVIQHYGAKNILLKWPQVLKEMRKYKHKIIRKKI